VRALMIRRGLHLGVFLLTEAQTWTLEAKTVRTVVTQSAQGTITKRTKRRSVAAYNGVVVVVVVKKEKKNRRQR
jgi:hypothetical protein